MNYICYKCGYCHYGSTTIDTGTPLNWEVIPSASTTGQDRYVCQKCIKKGKEHSNENGIL